jgi:hypothetical protein
VFYVEFCNRRSDASLEEFHRAWREVQVGWGDDFEDILVWSAARTWRLGPEPEYLAVWDVGDAGLDRLEEWDREFKSSGGNSHGEVFAASGRIDVSGWYRGLFPAVEVRGKRYYAEYFTPTGTDEQIQSFIANATPSIRIWICRC